VLPDGKVVRGMGTHFMSKEDKDTFDRRTSRGNAIRDEFNKRFPRFHFEGMYVVAPGAGRAFAAEFAGDAPEVVVSCDEYEISGAPGEKGLLVWAERLKEQYTRTPLGRAVNASDDGLDILEGLANCPVITEATRTTITNLILQARSGSMKREDFLRNLDLLQVEVDPTPLLAVERNVTI
jgi:hypothetical protein